jgi:uncharacterized protein (TIGR02246 family)
MARNTCLVATGCLLVFLIASPTNRARSADDGKSAGSVRDASASKRTADEAAVRKATADLVDGIEKGDARRVAAAWTTEGEFVGDDGAVLRGRAAIEDAYAKAFAKKKDTKVEVNIESIRFPSADTAIEDGTAKSHKKDADRPTTSRISILYVREGGRWLVAQLREVVAGGSALEELGWLIGTWEAKTDEAKVRTSYEWDAKKNSIRCHITVKGQDRTTAALQVLLEDPRTGQVRSWLFDDDGGFGDATWSRDGKRWVIAASGVQADGGELTATNILTPVDKDTFVWQSMQRTLEGEELPNIPPVKVTRVK